ncbi:LysR family transcriptional regulator [Thioclava sp. SK-1]|uniref:LysR family transcriptional regulator n=1 Tax=Thioclava sp. SK-1 TaxID=1889770 RepID=UPI000825B40C|nr:LysR family transcriptional regulator [Thioclava sp. SK-1]OCX66874.1 LysR family transcriptional regulator [Thioclava sp. SK-1]
MLRENITDLIAFAAVARERSFTRAAGQIGVSQSALSHTIRALEERLGLRLLTRTTRSVSTTPAGERLLKTLALNLEQIEAELRRLSEMRDTPAGTIRLTAPDFAVEGLLWPKLMPVIQAYPDVNLEIIVDYNLTDIASERFDAGVRYGGRVSEGMIAQRIGPDVRLLCVATPAYWQAHGRPETPQDLMDHNCINVRLPSHGGLYAWEFEKDGRELRVHTPGQLVFNAIGPMVAATLDGIGVSFMPDFYVADHLTSGRLEAVLGSWSQPFDGLHLFYPSRRHASPAFKLLIEALRYRG